LKYSIELGKIVEGALKHDQIKVMGYTQQLIKKLEEDGDSRSASKFVKLLNQQMGASLSVMGTVKGENIPVDIESRTTLAEIIYPSQNNIDVILSKSNYEKLKMFVLSYQNADKLNSLGIGVSNTLLLYGPPGCGKTKCAYLIAKELSLPLVIARLDSLISSYLGTTAKNIRTLFEYTQKMPCVLFIDEFDAIAKARDDNNELGELKRVVNSLLQNVDAMSKDSLLLAATNHEQLLDSAVWRRFDYKLRIELPDTDAIIRLIDLFIGDYLELNTKEKIELAHACNNLSGSNIEEIINKAIRGSVIYNKQFQKTDIYEELFLFNHIFASEKESERDLQKRKALFLRKCDEKIFSYATISSILNISKTTAASLVSLEGNKNE